MRRYLFLAVALLLGACSGAAAPTGRQAPGTSPGDQPSPVAIATPEEAAARVVTDADGRYAVALPAGPYVVEPQPADGILRMAEPVSVTVGDGFVDVDLAYDTGIR
jgi:hypothetical protein